MLLFVYFLYSDRNKQKIELTEPTTSEDIQQWITYKGSADKPNIVLISGDEEYRSEEALPQLARILSLRHGFNCHVLFSQDPENPGIVNPNYRNNIPGLDALEKADLMIIFIRYRQLPDSQMQYIDRYLKLGMPVFGIRTSTHAFSFENNDAISSYKQYSKSYSSNDIWNGGFGKCVLGQNWIAHHGRHRHQSTRGIIAPGASEHPVTNGIGNGEIWGPTDVYRVKLPLATDWQPLVLGQVIEREAEYDELDPLYGMRVTDNQPAGIQMDEELGKSYDPNDPLMPIAWTKPYQIPGGSRGKAFVMTIGASQDMLADGTRRLMVNAVYWCLNLKVPENANVEIVGAYQPTTFKFGDDAYWLNKYLQISRLY